MGKMLLLFALVLFVLGLAFLFGSRIPYLGRLPGDIRIERDGFAFYFPLTTCLLISLLLSVVFWLLRR
ncbi:MAG: DUF2905 domain-containing protein [Candidatus Hydrogenedentota bacterium]|nr:MAG: DUF2905 domain-containing protein [Candidatus Hydrogenedentota bacterium]